METSQLTAFCALPNTYEGLCNLLLPRPIHDDLAYKNAVEMVDVLAGQCLNQDQADYLDALSDHVGKWEDQHSTPLCSVTPADAVQFLLESNGMSARDLAELLQISESAAYRILNGTRNLTVDHIKALCQRFHVEPKLFLAI